MKRPKSIILLPNDVEVSIDSLDPEKIKPHATKAKERYKSGSAKTSDGSVAKLTRIQNDLACALGPFGNFTEYGEAYRGDLQTFLRRNDLHVLSDLITARRWYRPSKDGNSTQNGAYGMLCMQPRCSHQSVSERLFLSGKPLPERVFTGYDFDYWSRFEDGGWILSRDLCHGDMDSPLGLRSGWSTGDMDSNIKLAFRDGDTKVDIPGRSDHPSRALIDIVLGGHLDEVAEFYHLRGDTLVRGNAYPAQRAGKEDEGKAIAPSLEDLFRYRIDSQEQGWVEVLPFNERLIFLKGAGGEYDFLVRNERDRRFDTQVYGAGLPPRQVSVAIPDYSFEHWYHFRHHGWKEQEREDAHEHYWGLKENNLTPPNPRTVLMHYYTHTKEFQSITHGRRFLSPGFHEVQLEGKRLAISDLVIIEEVLSWHSDPQADPRPTTDEPLLPVNAYDDKALPASVTWNAAMSYAGCLGARLKLPLRLPTFAELGELRTAVTGRPIVPPHRLMTSEEGEEFNKAEQGRPPSELLLHFLSPEGEPINGHPPYMPEDEFNAMRLVYRTQPKWIGHSSGIRFVDSAQFAEWVQEKACLVGWGTPTDPYCGINSLHTVIGEDSTGKYKGFKTGFRLCYDILSDA